MRNDCDGKRSKKRQSKSIGALPFSPKKQLRGASGSSKELAVDVQSSEQNNREKEKLEAESAKRRADELEKKAEIMRKNILRRLRNPKTVSKPKACELDERVESLNRLLDNANRIKLPNLAKKTKHVRPRSHAVIEK